MSVRAEPLPLKAVLARWDALVIRWGLDSDERSTLIGGFRGGAVDRVETYEVLCGEQRMRLLVELEPVLAGIHGDELRVRSWLRSPNPNLCGRSPISVMSSSPEWIRWLIDHLGVAS